MVALEEVVQVDGQELERDAEVGPEVHVLQEVHHVVPRVGVAMAQVLQDLELHEGLVMEALLVADHLDGHLGACGEGDGQHLISAGVLHTRKRTMRTPSHYAPVLWSRHRRTCPKEPLPRVPRISHR